MSTLTIDRPVVERLVREALTRRLRPGIASRGLDQGAFPPSPILLIIDFLLRSSGRNENVMGARRIRREQRQHDQAKSRLDNGFLKAKERIRRDARMLGMVKAGKLPYTPVVMSWLSVKLHKPSRLITQADVQKLLK